MYDKPDTVDAVKMTTAVRMLNTYVREAELAALIDAMEALARSPEDNALRTRVHETFAELGILQGAVLTYAPYLAEILGDPFDAD